MNIFVLLYDGFFPPDIVFACLEFRDENLLTVALEDRVYNANGQKLVPDKILADLNKEEIDLFIIPGGRNKKLFDNQELKSFLLDLNERNIYIAGLCNANYLMANYGLLENKKITGTGNPESDKEYKDILKKSTIVDEDFVKDGNIITAPGRAFIEFAVGLGKLMDVYENEEEAEKICKWLKNIK